MSLPDDGIPVVSANANLRVADIKKGRIKPTAKKRRAGEPSAPVAYDVPAEVAEAEAEPKAPEPEAQAPAAQGADPEDNNDEKGAEDYNADPGDEYQDYRSASPTDSDEGTPASTEFTPPDDDDEYEDDDRLTGDPDNIDQEFVGAWNEELDFD